MVQSPSHVSLQLKGGAGKQKWSKTVISMTMCACVCVVCAYGWACMYVCVVGGDQLKGVAVETWATIKWIRADDIPVSGNSVRKDVNRPGVANTKTIHLTHQTFLKSVSGVIFIRIRYLLWFMWKELMGEGDGVWKEGMSNLAEHRKYHQKVRTFPTPREESMPKAGQGLSWWEARLSDTSLPYREVLPMGL